MEIDEGCTRARTAGSYQLGGVIGVGAFGEVRFGKCTRSDAQVSVKIVDTSKFRDEVDVSLKREVDILRMLQHKNIIQMLDFIEDVSLSGTFCSCCGCTEYAPMEDLSSANCANCVGCHDAQAHSTEETRLVSLIVQEIALGGELFNILQHNGPLSEDIARFYFLDLVKTLQFCHSKGVVHRDIKPENLMLDENFHLKIIDFGLAFVQEDQCGSLLHGSVGSMPYSAPEVYYNKELYRSQGYRGEPADVWSCAVTLFIMLTAKPPFKRPLHKNYSSHLKKCLQFTGILDGHYPPSISPMAKDLLRKLFQLNPSHRLSLEEIPLHPWCRGELPSDERIIERMTDYAQKSWKQQGKWWLSDKLLANRFNWSISFKTTSPFNNDSEQKHVELMVSDVNEALQS